MNYKSVPECSEQGHYKHERLYLPLEQCSLGFNNETEKKRIAGYGAVFYDPNNAGTMYKLTPKVAHRIAPGAFQELTDVIAAFNHNFDYLLGRTPHTLKLNLDLKGLHYSIDIDENDPQAMSVYAKIKRGDVRGSSISFHVLEDRWDRVDGVDIRTLLNVKVIEVGPVTTPAMTATTSQAFSSSHNNFLAELETRKRQDFLKTITK